MHSVWTSWLWRCTAFGCRKRRFQLCTIDVRCAFPADIDTYHFHPYTHAHACTHIHSHTHINACSFRCPTTIIPIHSHLHMNTQHEADIPNWRQKRKERKEKKHHPEKYTCEPFHPTRQQYRPTIIQSNANHLPERMRPSPQMHEVYVLDIVLCFSRFDAKANEIKLGKLCVCVWLVCALLLW